MYLFITALLIALIAIIFALQNAAPVAVSFLFWHFEGSLALILIVTFTLGVAVSLLLSIFSVLRGEKKTKETAVKDTAEESDKPLGENETQN